MKSKLKKAIPAKDFHNLTKEEVIELANRCSWIHKDRVPKYIGKKYEYLERKVPKEYRKKAYNMSFHIVLYKKTSETEVDRVVFIDFNFRNCFQMYNIVDNKLIEVYGFQDDLFKVYEYFSAQGYKLPHANKK